jgi:putative protease
MKKNELPAPAKNPETGIAAVNSGADAVYIGAEKFGARAAAGNSVKDIEKLINYAHIYNTRVYAAVNTIFFDDELEQARTLINNLYDTGIDSIIIQDTGILEMDISSIPVHASTQMNNFDIERIKFFDRVGIKRIVLARELSLAEIIKIRNETECELEFFVHGTLCVSLSGQCYMSASIGGRSGNRGDCAQPCRNVFDPEDAAGNVIMKG